MINVCQIEYLQHQKTNVRGPFVCNNALSAGRKTSTSLTIEKACCAVLDQKFSFPTVECGNLPPTLATKNNFQIDRIAT